MKVARNTLLIALLIAVCVVILDGIIPLGDRPAISGYHWNGTSLYDSAGSEVASVIYLPFNSSQACLFITEQHGCSQWETREQAYADIAHRLRFAADEVRGNAITFGDQSPAVTTNGNTIIYEGKKP